MSEGLVPKRAEEVETLIQKSEWRSVISERDFKTEYVVPQKQEGGLKKRLRFSTHVLRHL